MKDIPLQNGLVAVVDEADHAELSKFNWRAARSSSGTTFYAYRRGGRNSVSMHGHLLGRRPGMVIDHRDRNGLHNWRANLRWATYGQNGINRLHRNKTGWRGVSCDRGNYVAKTRKLNLGRFRTAEEAAAVYNWAAERLHGEFAVLNANREGEVLASISPDVRTARFIEVVAQGVERVAKELRSTAHSWSAEDLAKAIQDWKTLVSASERSTQVTVGQINAVKPPSEPAIRRFQTDYRLPKGRKVLYVEEAVAWYLDEVIIGDNGNIFSSSKGVVSV